MEKDLMKKEKKFLKQKMEKEKEKGQYIMRMLNYYLRENFQMVVYGTEKEKNIIMENYYSKENI